MRMGGPYKRQSTTSKTRVCFGRSNDASLGILLSHFPPSSVHSVTERIQALLETGRELAAAARLQGLVECARIPKKVGYFDCCGTK